MANKDILDATQDAVLNAASSVADVLENTAEEFGGAAEPFYMEAEFWVGAAFVLVVLALARPVGKAVLGLLRARGEGIAKRIAEAVNLKEEAQRLKAEYERKFRGAEKEAAETLKRSEREIEALKKDTLARLEADMQKREQEVKMHLEMAQAAAVDAVAASAADLTMAAVRKILTDKLDDADYDRMIDEAINEI
ncbi:MAG: hypothetical protein IJ529_04100 [Alphaproteobacteria bacterium]|nr:hypothetical protein [Alphaproteobacteria bacterium]MBQ9235683.1 hypothetical protein [Alphaproteobacteria bacterium]